MKSRIIKRVLSTVLAIIMILGCMPLTTFAATEYTYGDYTYTVSGSDATVVAYPETATGSVSIPSTLNGYTVKKIGAYAFYSCTNLTGVTIPNTVTEIGNYAFAYCITLSKIDIPSSVTSIGTNAFKNSNKVVISCESGSYAEQYAKAQGISTNTGGVVSKDTAAPDGTTISLSKDVYEYKIGEEFPLSGELYSPKGTSGITLNWSVTDATGVTINTPASMLNTDANNIIFSALTTGKKAGSYTVTVKTSNGASSTREIIISKSGSSEADQYVGAHLRFIDDPIYSQCISNRYGEYLWENYHSHGYKAAAEFAYDILEGSYEVVTFKVLNGGLSGLKNPYDTLILELLSRSDTGDSITKSTELKLESNLLKFLKDIIKIGSSDEKWLEGFDVAGELKDLFVLKAEKKDYSSNKFYKALSSNLGSVGKENVRKVFAGVSYCGEVLDYINDGLSVIEYILECLEYFSAVEAYVSSTQEFRTALNQVSKNMEKNDYSKKFDEALGHFSACCSDEAAMREEVLKHIAVKGLTTVADMCRDVFQNLAQKVFTTALKMSKEASAKLVAAIWAYEKGFQIANLLTGNDNAVENRRLLRANYWFEDAVVKTVSAYKTNLKNTKTYDDAKLFDAAFRMMKFSELYALQLHCNYLESQSETPLNFVIGKRDEFYNEYLAWAKEKAAWEYVACHSNNPSLDYQKGDFYHHDGAVVACPTNVYVYDSENKLISSVVHDVISIYNPEIYVFDFNGQKTILVSDIEKYNIVIEAYENGYMNYYCSQFKNNAIVHQVNFNNTSISKGQKYQFVVAGNGKDVSEASYLKNNSKKIYATSVHIHSWEEWKTIKEASTTQSGLLERACSVCKCKEQLETNRLVDSSASNVKSVSVDDVTMNYKASTTIKPKVDADEGITYTVKYESSNPKVASVDENGNVKALKKGNATITVTVTDQYGNVVEDTCTVTVKYTFFQWIIKILLFGWIWY